MATSATLFPNLMAYQSGLCVPGWAFWGEGLEFRVYLGFRVLGLGRARISVRDSVTGMDSSRKNTKGDTQDP